mgnify:CR=1 FL=1
MGAAQESHFVSAPIKLDGPGCRVFLNADGLSANSCLRVELTDERFGPLPGYSAENCVPMTESGLRVPVSWRDRPTIETDSPVRVKVNFAGLRPEDIRVYAVYVG